MDVDIGELDLQADLSAEELLVRAPRAHGEQ